MVHTKKIPISTKKHSEMIDITNKISNIIKESKINDGFCYIFNPHTTAALTINEKADPDVMIDILSETDKIVPWNNNYRHMEGNSAAHIKASFFGTSLNIIIDNGKLVLGTWQGIFFCEFDGPRNRHLIIKITSD